VGTPPAILNSHEFGIATLAGFSQYPLMSEEDGASAASLLALLPQVQAQQFKNLMERIHSSLGSKPRTVNLQLCFRELSIELSTFVSGNGNAGADIRLALTGICHLGEYGVTLCCRRVLCAIFDVDQRKLSEAVSACGLKQCSKELTPRDGFPIDLKVAATRARLGSRFSPSARLLGAR
jgi:hypothetical protein